MGDLTVLKAGATVPSDVIELGIAVERHGARLVLVDDVHLGVVDAEHLPDAVRQRLRSRKDHMIAVLREFATYQREISNRLRIE